MGAADCIDKAGGNLVAWVDQFSNHHDIESQVTKAQRHKRCQPNRDRVGQRRLDHKVIGGAYLIPRGDKALHADRFIRNIHGETKGHVGSYGKLLWTRQTRRLDGSEGAPYHQFLGLTEWAAEAKNTRGQAGWFFCFSTFRRASASTEALQDLTACWLDLDWHKLPHLVARYGSPEAVLAEVDRRCDSRGIPRPNRAHASGRGLLAAWQFTRVPAYGRSKSGERRDGPLVRWWVVQEFLHELFADLNADQQAKSPVHFFKVPGTINPKSGALVRVLREPLEREGGVFSFSSLYHVVEEAIRASHAALELRTTPLPLRERRGATKGNVADLAARRAITTGKAGKAKRGEDGKGVDDASAASLIWAPRLRALVQLAEHRVRGGALPAGERNGLLFTIAVALSHICGPNWRDEAVRLAIRFTLGAWSEKEAMARFSAVAKTIAKLERGETVTWEGRQVDPRYRMRDETVLAFADVIQNEERLEFMRPLARESIQRAWKASKLASTRRDTRHRSDRSTPTTGLDKENAALKRKADAQARIRRAHELLTGGLTVAEVAREMGQDPRVIRGYLSKPPAADPVPAQEPAAIPEHRPAATLPMPVVVRPAWPRTIRGGRAPNAVHEAELEYRACRLVIQDGYDVAQAADKLGVPVERVRVWLALQQAA